ncbi:hypothetical protein LTR49_024961 [Elasticomyces elasticus]|nr:hypothetical protein LTR49_024961 [Elasticomyces elasticus]KAK5737874.1 hypothetical protein LTS12_025749 [Elasticomyces elasticus]
MAALALLATDRVPSIVPASTHMEQGMPSVETMVVTIRMLASIVVRTGLTGIADYYPSSTVCSSTAGECNYANSLSSSYAGHSSSSSYASSTYHSSGSSASDSFTSSAYRISTISSADSELPASTVSEASSASTASPSASTTFPSTSTAFSTATSSESTVSAAFTTSTMSGPVTAPADPISEASTQQRVLLLAVSAFGVLTGVL